MPKHSRSLAASRVHFIGIGGIGMSGLAELLHNMGAEVSGSDQSANVQTQRLEALGVQVQLGHRAENLGDCDVVVYSSAVKGTNPEYAAARERRVPLIPRAEALAEVMRLSRGIAVGGSHGKTTTTSLLASIFIHAEKEPTICVGGRLDLIQSTAKLGTGEWMIAEADESDGSFSRLTPEIAIVTNIDNDHLDHYGTFENLKKAFFDFAHRVPFYGSAVLCWTDEHVRDAFENYGKRAIRYGLFESVESAHQALSGEAPCDLVAAGTQGEYQVFSRDPSGVIERRGKYRMAASLPGRHNASNALAAIAVGLECGLSFAECADGIQRFSGVDRRFQWKGNEQGIDLFDDYGHHPTEIRAVLSAFREKYGSRKLVVAFQPHRYTRTHLCWDQFKDCFGLADVLLLTDIYAAGESPIASVTAPHLIESIQTSAFRPKLAIEHIQTRVSSGHWFDHLADRIAHHVRPGDAVFTLGAGDISRSSETILQTLRAKTFTGTTGTAGATETTGTTGPART